MSYLRKPMVINPLRLRHFFSNLYGRLKPRTMLKNYFNTAWRNLAKNKVHSFINLSGLSVGLACSLLILLWVQDEMGVDAYHRNDARLYKVYEREYYADHIDGNDDTPGVLADELKKQVPEIEDAVAMQENNSLTTLQAGNKILKVSGMAAGEHLFSVFSYPLLQGIPANALSSTSVIAISKKTAIQFFGSPQMAMGKTLRFNNTSEFAVSAVFDDVPANASRKFDYVISWQSWLANNKWATRWGNSGPLTYILLRQGANPQAVDKKLSRFLDKYVDNTDASYHVEYGLQKFSSVYLQGNFKDGYVSGGRIEYVRLFSIVAAFILIIACINFMNLTTARSIKRAREVGVRKAIGALRSVLIRQFIGESLMLTAAAVIFALALMVLILPLFNQVTQKQITIPYADGGFWVKLLSITLITGLLAGSYPALFLSSFNPVKVLKGMPKFSSGAILLRKGLVVFQFVLSTVLITGTIVVSKQVDFIQNRNLGYDRENVIRMRVEGAFVSKYATLKDEMLKMPGVESISRISDNPTYLDQQTNSVDWEGRAPDTKISFERPDVGYDLVQTMKLELKEGRYFSKDFPTDKNACVLNETAAKKIGYTHAVGRIVTLEDQKMTVIGVLKDFHYRSLHEQIEPLIMRLNDGDSYGNILIRTKPGQTKQALAGIETLCKQVNPQYPFAYTFLDEEYQQLYKSEEVVGKLSNAFAFLAIFICCLGLLGLVMFTNAQRTKEIGIRKVLGASVTGIVQLISVDFLKLVVLAIVIACPIAWWAMSAWLNGYAYKIDIGWAMFAQAGGLAIAIAIFTISFQAIKAGLANPVGALRSE